MGRNNRQWARSRRLEVVSRDWFGGVSSLTSRVWSVLGFTDNWIWIGRESGQESGESLSKFLGAEFVHVALILKVLLDIGGRRLTLGQCLSAAQ